MLLLHFKLSCNLFFAWPSKGLLWSSLTMFRSTTPHGRTYRASSKYFSLYSAPTNSLQSTASVPLVVLALDISATKSSAGHWSRTKKDHGHPAIALTNHPPRPPGIPGLIGLLLSFCKGLCLHLSHLDRPTQQKCLHMDTSSYQSISRLETRTGAYSRTSITRFSFSLWDSKWCFSHRDWRCTPPKTTPHSIL